MFSGPRTGVGMGINGTGAIPKVGYLKGSGGVAPLRNAGLCSGARSVWRLSLLNSLYTRLVMPLMDRLERRGGLFLDLASALLFGGKASISSELSEDNSSFVVALLSSDRTGSLYLFYLTGAAGWLLLNTFVAYSSPKQVRRRSFSYCR